MRPDILSVCKVDMECYKTNLAPSANNWMSDSTTLRRSSYIVSKDLLVHSARFLCLPMLRNHHSASGVRDCVSEQLYEKLHHACSGRDGSACDTGSKQAALLGTWTSYARVQISSD